RLRHPAEEGKGRDMPVQESPRRLRRIGLGKRRVGMGQIKAEHVQRRAHAADHPDALAEINLGMVGWMSQRYEARFSRTQSFTVSPPAYPYSARNRSKIRLAVCRCFGGALRS